MRFSYCDKILLEVLRHKLLGHIYKQWTYARNNNMRILGCEFSVAFEHVTAWFTVE